MPPKPEELAAPARHMTPAGYGSALAARMPAITDKQVDEVARIIASAEWVRRDE